MIVNRFRFAILFVFGAFVLQAQSKDWNELFNEAQKRFESIQQTGSIPMFESLIRSIESESKQRSLTKEEQSIIEKCYDLLGQAEFNRNEQSKARSAFRKLLEWNPDYKMNEDLVSKKIINLFNSEKRDSVAMLTVRSTPPGATVRLDGRELGITNLENVSILNGKHLLQIQLQGYKSQTNAFEIQPGSMKEISVVLAKGERVAEEIKSEQITEEPAIKSPKRSGDLLREAYALMSSGNYGEAEKKYDEALTASRETGDKANQANALLNLGFLYSSSGRESQAVPYWEESLSLTREIGDGSREALALYNLAIAAYNRGDLKKADELYEQSVQVSNKLGEEPRKKLW
jgi:tetratricopeptide (TPR) repeat protein